MIHEQCPIKIAVASRFVPTERHIVVAWGRDFGDVTPMRGVLLGGGRHELIVGVDVSPVEA